jgi:uncharacterized tellurite resistance protein B-like protein
MADSQFNIMTIKDFTDEQKQALLDLTVLAMYADAHLASAEDQRVQRLLGVMGFETDYDRGKQYDASVSRVSRNSQTAESARLYAGTLVLSFVTREQRRLVQDTLTDVVASDSHVSPQESGLLSLVRESLEK